MKKVSELEKEITEKHQTIVLTREYYEYLLDWMKEAEKMIAEEHRIEEPTEFFGLKMVIVPQREIVGRDYKLMREPATLIEMTYNDAEVIR
ncbi:MAG: hypothetical protein ACOCRO_04760 [Halanaerobiales bacterium]